MLNLITMIIGFCMYVTHLYGVTPRGDTVVRVQVKCKHSLTLPL